MTLVFLRAFPPNSSDVSVGLYLAFCLLVEKWGLSMQSKAVFVFLICVTTVLFCSLAIAKPSIDLGFEKDNGYGVGNDIGGLWAVSAHVSSDVKYVEFYLDGQLQQNDSSAPFSWQFDTSNYSAGSHAIKAVAYDSLGDTAFLQVERNFQETSTGTVTGIIVAVVIIIIVAVIGFALYSTRVKK